MYQYRYLAVVRIGGRAVKVAGTILLAKAPNNDYGPAIEAILAKHAGALGPVEIKSLRYEQ